MSKDTNQSDRRTQQHALTASIICGILLFLGGVLMAWALFPSSHISVFWPGLIIGFCFTLFLPYSAIKIAKQKTTQAAPAKNTATSWGGLGAGVGVLILGLFRENEMLMVNIGASAVSMLLGIGFFTVALAIWKRSQEA